MNISHQQVIQQLDKPVNEITQLIYQKTDVWAQFVVFSWRWWLGIALSILPWIFWYVATRKSQSIHRLLFASGSFVISISVILDIVGDQYGLWHYRFNVVPIMPTYFPWDYSLQPVIIMSVIQVFPTANPYIKAAVFSLLASFVGEPIFHAIDVYVLIHWRYVYSVPIQFIIYLVADFLCKRTHKYAELR